MWALVSTVDAQADKYTKRACKRAIRARKLQNIIMRPGERKFREVCLQHLKNCPVTKGDAAVALDIFGQGSLKGKTPRSTAEHVPAGVDPVPPEILNVHQHVMLSIDIMYVNKIPFLTIISQNLRFGTVENLPDRRVSTITSKLRSVIRLYEH